MIDNLSKNSEVSQKPTTCTNPNLMFLSIEKGWHAEVFVPGIPTKHRFFGGNYLNGIQRFDCFLTELPRNELPRNVYTDFFAMFHAHAMILDLNGAPALHVIQFNIHGQETCIHESWAILPWNMWKGFPAGGKRANFIVACGSEMAEQNNFGDSLPWKVPLHVCHFSWFTGFQKNAQL